MDEASMKMPKIIFLNGCINAGKSTVAKRLKEIVSNLAHVEVDDLHAFISWMPIEQAIHLNWENSVLVSKTFLKAGIDVIFTYPLSKADYEHILPMFSGVHAQFIPVTLFSSREILKTNRGYRILTEWEEKRIEWMFENGLAVPNFGVLIDNTKLSIDQTVEEVIRVAHLQRK
jgi:hypothetical protein